MRFQLWKLYKNMPLSIYLKCGAIFLFLTLTVLIVACGGKSTNTNAVDPSTPVVTVTIRIGQSNSSPTPRLPDYMCGAWATNTSPSYSSSVVSVYAKFTHNVDGNPVGVDAANAIATIMWPDGSSNTESATTTSDGLAVFPVAIKPIALDKLVLIDVTFSKPGIPNCTVPQAAYFSVIIASPTAALSTPPLATSPTSTQGETPTPGVTLTPIPTIPPTPTPRPKPTRTPHP